MFLSSAAGTGGGGVALQQLSPPAGSWAGSGPSEDGRRQPLTTDNDHGGAAHRRAPVVRQPGQTHVSSHIRARQSSIGIAVPV
ncbi:hypothetical protein GCM10010365_10160 [Streptomyces poonensis]|uniref:Uncharacterized protein n=1 Tax=Streptomyces poonensis TaxID=68255 RepID=A0A918PAD4_9ACTN|nr:hypothetical protein GCM10010365_10160 [Streptomyces poonensis]GLJ87544.1 hypothetical protein GCM10017589_01440 [Streptomyces poonensis]